MPRSSTQRRTVCAGSFGGPTSRSAFSRATSPQRRAQRLRSHFRQELRPSNIRAGSEGDRSNRVDRRAHARGSRSTGHYVQVPQAGAGMGRRASEAGRRVAELGIDADHERGWRLTASQVPGQRPRRKIDALLMPLAAGVGPTRGEAAAMQAVLRDGRRTRAADRLDAEKAALRAVNGSICRALG